MNKPDFFCVGFAKSGTTTLYQILKQHPDIFLSSIKEPWFYGKSEIYEKGFNWYLNRFYRNIGNKKIIGEINPLLSDISIPKKIYNDFGSNLKLIFIMRNPVDRLYSHYKMELNGGYNFEKIEDHLRYSDQIGFSKYLHDNLVRNKSGNLILKQNKQKDKFNCGRYNSIIKEYLKYFSKSNMKFIIFEEFLKEKEPIMKDLLQFLELNDTKPLNYEIHANEGNRIPYSIMSIKVSQWIQMRAWNWYIKDCAFTNNYLDSIMFKLKKQMNILCTKNNKNPSAMSQKCRNILEEYYKNDISELSVLIDKDLSRLWFKY